MNSHVLYGQAVDQLLLSLLSVGFANFCSLVVVLGGSQLELPPERRGNLTYVETVLNAQDTHALDVLSRYHNHRLVRADAYFYMLDTCLVHVSFLRFFASLPRLFEGNKDGILKPPVAAGVQSVILAFGRGVPQKWHDFYHKNISKNEAIIVEQHSALMGRWGKMKFCRPRRYEHIEEDVYNRGSPRRLYFYPDFGVYKLVLWLKSGDFTGTLVQNTNKRDLRNPYTGLQSNQLNDGQVQPGETVSAARWAVDWAAATVVRRRER